MQTVSFLSLVLLLPLAYPHPSQPLDSNLPSIPSLPSLNADPVLHFAIKRRGGSFDPSTPSTSLANFTYIADELRRIAKRYSRTRREVNGNKLARKARAKGVGGGDVSSLISDVQQDGTWFVTMGMGTPPQFVELDLDMLTSDFYVVTTTSREGSRYDDLFSSTMQKSNQHPFTSCTVPTESFLLPSLAVPANLQFAYCRPSKSSSRTLAASGSMLGLAASKLMTQIKSPSLISQLEEQGVIKWSVFSIMLINGHEGVLSIGGSAAKAIESADAQTKAALDQLGAAAKLEEDSTRSEIHGKRSENLGVESEDLDSMFRWSAVQGADGWWQILMKEVWNGERKVLKNQPAIVDINTPLIIAPPDAAARVYASISGAYPLPEPYAGLYAFPCLNPPGLAFEVGGWNFPAFRGGGGSDDHGREAWGRPGGRLSLGRLENGSGYCIGSILGLDMSEVVEMTEELVVTNLGSRQPRQRTGSRGGQSAVQASGLKGVWIMGEMWLRGVNAMFDLKDQRIGFRST